MYAKSDDDEAMTAGLLIEESASSYGGGYRALHVYKLAHALGVAAHKFSLVLPKYELFESGSQLRRAAKSVAANIVEGYGRRRYKAEYVRFLTIAKASLDETEEHLAFIRECHPAQASQANTLLLDADLLGRKLARFIDLVEANHRS